VKFHWIMTFFTVVMSLGGIIDAREHLQHGFEIESFFVASHYLLYAGWMLGGAALAIRIHTQRRNGKSMREWLPKGYSSSLLGFLIFGFGGGIDLVWHELFGFEAALEAPISPGHLLLVLGAGLMYSAIIFHALHLRSKMPDEFSSSLNVLNIPIVLAMISLLTAVLWPTWFLDPQLIDFPSGGVIAKQIHAFRMFDYGIPVANAAGISGIFLMTLLTMPFLLLPLYRWRMPVGYLTLTVVGYAGLRAVVGNSYIYLPAPIGAAMLGDLIWAWMRRGGELRLSSSTGYRMMAFSMPTLQYVIYFGIIGWSVGSLIWSPALWAGAAVTAGTFSLLMSYALIKPTSHGIDSFLYRLDILGA